jgi:predicted N-acyltransferase
VTACLEGRRLQARRSLDLHRPDSRFYTVHVHRERARQKMSRAFFAPIGKTCHVLLLLILAKTVARNSGQEVTLLFSLYILVIIAGNVS